MKKIKISIKTINGNLGKQVIHSRFLGRLSQHKCSCSLSGFPTFLVVIILDSLWL